MKNKLPAWLVLTVICVVAAALLAGTNLLTKDIIAENANREKFTTLTALLPDASKFEERESGVIVGLDDSGNPVGYALAAVTQGFGGEVETTVATRTDGTIGGISVGGSNFAETAGLGARAKEPEFQEQFAGKTAPVALTKDGGEIEALSGATITSRAVIKGVNEAMDGIAAEAGFTVEKSISSEHLGENKYAASAQGFGGPVKVYLTLDENRAIQEIDIGDSRFAETPDLGAKAKEDAFQAQFIGKTLPVTIGDIDAISGATITTNAVLEAISTINTDLDSGLADTPITEEAAPAETSSSGANVRKRGSKSATATEAPAAETTSSGSSSSRRRRTTATEAANAGSAAASAPAVNQDGNKYDAAAQGFAGPVRVYLTLEGKTIQEISIGDDSFAETPEFGGHAKDEEFLAQFIGKEIPLTKGDIDALSSATYTTDAVLKAINAIAEAVE